ncbi:MAG TPA: FAD-dependent oxidoreductase [Chromatiaceae bacterium]|nr:FAD-dependent oxidoreductase [Chromatiaceae bacterium]
MKKLGLLLITALIVVFFTFDLDRLLTLDALKAGQATFAAWYEASPWLVAGAYLLVYVAVTALSLPGAAVMTLAGGALFGLWVGTLLVSFASSIGATLAFLVSRWLLRDWVQGRYGARLAAVNAGMAKDGAFYLFTLRLVPVFPFFVINLLMGLTPIKTRTFYWVSQLGMLAGTLVYVNAGTQLARLDSLSGILSPGLVASFALLGVFPLLAKRLVALVQARQLYAGWQKPRRFDRNLVVIGAGSGGLVTAYIAAAVKARVTLVEQHRMGGDCLNTGCVPSKALIRTATLLAQLRRSQDFGIRAAPAEVDFSQVMERVRRVVRAVEPHDSAERYRGLGVDVVAGRARIVSPWAVEITGEDGAVQRLATRGIVIATGARPFVPPIPGIEAVGYLTSDNLWDLRTLPRRLVVLGGGPIGAELAQAFARLGSQVTQVEMLPRLLVREDPEVSDLIAERFRAEGILVLVDHRAKQFLVEDGEKILVAVHAGADRRIPFDAVLVAVGRVANLTGYGLEELGIPTGRTIETNAYLQTRYPNIYAVGDVAGPYQFTHTAAHQAWYAAVNALFSGFKRFKADYRVIPWVTFTSPEVARVGLSEAEAQAQGIAYEVTRYGLDDLDRAIADSDAQGFVKVLTPPGKDRILGVTLVGAHAGELLAEFTLAMKHGLGLNKILGTIHPYPTWSEAAKYAAGEWKRAHAPRTLLAALARFHSWRRG